MTTTTTTPAVATAPKALTRKDLLAALASHGYTGPTSFTAAVLRDVVDWFEAGSPKDLGAVPNGVLFAVHPDLKPTSVKAKPPTKIQQAVVAALIEAQTVLNDDGAAKAKIYLSAKVAELQAS